MPLDILRPPGCGILFARSLCIALVALALTVPAGGARAEGAQAAPDLRVAAADEKQRSGRAPLRDMRYGDYLAGVVANGWSDLSAAASFLLRSLERDPDNADLLRGTFVLVAADGRHAEAARLAQRVLADRPDDMAATLVAAVDAIEHGDLMRAAALFEALPDRGLGKIGTPLMAGWLAVERGDRPAGLALIDKVGETEGFGVIATLHRALVLDLADQPVEAEAAYRKALQSSSQASLRLTWLFGNFLERQGKTDEAIAIYERFQDENRSLNLLELAIERSRTRSAPAREVASYKDGIAEVLFSLATLLSQERADEMAQIQAHLALRLRPRFETARILIGEILENKTRPADAIAVYRQIDPASPFAWSARLRIADQLEALERIEEAIAELDSLAESRPEHFEPYFRKGNLLRGRERFEEAVQAYDEAFERIDEVRQRHWSMLYFRGIALERSGVWERAEVDFLKALELEPEQPYVMNYLAYSWVEQKAHLDEAKDMLIKAVELRPNDGFIVDSLGWVYYRMGEFQNAVEHLERAVELRPQDPVINDHLGDAFWQVGRQREARFQWRRSLNLEPEEDQVPLLEAKIKQGLVGQPEKI